LRKFLFMSIWLYQLSQESSWPPERFRHEIWEQRRWHWEHGQKRSSKNPKPGDTLVFFYSRRGGDASGVYGWAVVEQYDEEHGILYFTPASPTDHLKMDPWCGDDVQDVMDAIRGKMPQATLFPIGKPEAARIRRGIRHWLHSSE
jgi:hypothetical protein